MTEPEESALVKHARAELARINEEPDVVESYISMLQIFAKMGHSGYSASVFITTLNDLLMFKNLTSLTDDPEEWVDQSGLSDYPLWQSKRNPEAFSKDGGKTYILLSEANKVNSSVRAT